MDKERKQMIAFSSMIPGFIIICIGIVFVFIFIYTDDPAYNDPVDHAILTPEDTLGNNSINITKYAYRSVIKQNSWST